MSSGCMSMRKMTTVRLHLPTWHACGASVHLVQGSTPLIFGMKAYGLTILQIHMAKICPCHIMCTHALLSLSLPHRSSPILLSTLSGRAHGGINCMSTPAIAHFSRDWHAMDFQPAWPWYSTTKPTMCTIELRTSSADGSVIVQAPSPVWPTSVFF